MFSHMVMAAASALGSVVQDMTMRRRAKFLLSVILFPFVCVLEDHCDGCCLQGQQLTFVAGSGRFSGRGRRPGATSHVVKVKVLSNPVFAQLDKRTPSVGYAPLGGVAHRGSPGVLTLDAVVVRTLGLFGLMLAAAAVTWKVASLHPEYHTIMWGAGLVGTLVLGLVISFKKTISVPLILLYAPLEGLFVGAISQSFAAYPGYEGVVPQAVLATLCVFAGIFAGWKFGLVRVTSRSRRIFGFLVMGYLLFSLVNLALVWTGVLDGWGVGNNSWLGIGISAFAIALASYSLAIDFDSIQRGVSARLPEKYAWLMAHGLLVSVVWLYLEILRLLARLRD